MNIKQTLVSRGTHLPCRVLWVCGAIVLLALFLAAPASATVEQVATFADEPGNQQLLNVESIAVNTTGAGGVPAGTVYAVSRGQARVLRYSAAGEFREAWGWGVGDGGHELQSCGPDGNPLNPICQNGMSGEGLGALSNEPKGIAVDESTGDVYVLNQREDKAHAVVQVFDANGAEAITGFGEQAVTPKEPTPGERIPGESIAESPEKIHLPSGGFAVDDAGNVYITDGDYGTIATSPEEARVMVFKPKTAGDYSDYLYAGRADDIDKTNLDTSNGTRPGELALDGAGNLYSSNESHIAMFARENLTPRHVTTRSPAAVPWASRSMKTAAKPSTGHLRTRNTIS